MSKFAKNLIILLLICALPGCAKAIRGETQQIQINAYNENTDNNVSAKCKLSNDEGNYDIHSGRSIVVGRDKDLLKVACETDDGMTGEVTVDGKVNVGFWAIDFFIIDACIISCWVDGLSGAWAEYPNIIDVPMTPVKITKQEQLGTVTN